MSEKPTCNENILHSSAAHTVLFAAGASLLRLTRVPRRDCPTLLPSPHIALPVVACVRLIKLCPSVTSLVVDIKMALGRGLGEAES
ncbi:MAG: hypothetical protein IKQ75_04265 [Bacteroidales bacterium]|nr:hypothetical protein [Bacteroidales bacterium]MBR6161063.1 hypothetical protein [Bacteroidales bacterium]